MQHHEDLVEEAKRAINAVFSDDSVSQSETRSSLQDLIGEIEIMLDSLRE